jgi:hypothetical protein
MLKDLLAYLTFVGPSCAKPGINTCAMGFCKTAFTFASKIYENFFLLLLANSEE